MSEFNTFDDYVAEIISNPPLTRMQFLRTTRFGLIRQLPGTVVNLDQARAVGCAMGLSWIRPSLSCPVCGSQFHLGIKTRRGGTESLVWRGPSPKQARIGNVRKCWCYGRQRSVALGSILETVCLDNWLDFLDVCMMWSCDYPKAVMCSELKGGSHQSIDRWCTMLQREAATKMAQPNAIILGGQGVVVEVEKQNVFK